MQTWRICRFQATTLSKITCPNTTSPSWQAKGRHTLSLKEHADATTNAPSALSGVIGKPAGVSNQRSVLQTKWRTVNREFGSEMIWLTDDNFGTGQRPKEIAEEIIAKQLPDDVTWFVQARCDDIIRNKDILPRLAKSGLSWVLLGVENSSPATLDYFKKGITPNDAKTAVRLLQDNGIMAHAMVIIGNRKETHQSILQLREFANDLDPDFLMFGILTPFPGTEVYAEAERNGWIEDRNWNHYDMIHAIMPTETLSTHQIQEELYGCYRDFYGSWSRRFHGLFSSNPMKRRTFRHMVASGVLGKIKSMF